MFFTELCRELATAAPPVRVPPPTALDANFEVELNANLAALFGGLGTRLGDRTRVQ
jgi:hypothetical protein